MRVVITAANAGGPCAPPSSGGLGRRRCLGAAPVAQASPPASSRTVPVRIPRPSGETPLPLAGGDACDTAPAYAGLHAVMAESRVTEPL